MFQYFYLKRPCSDGEFSYLNPWMLFFIYFVFLELVFVLQWLFLQWEIQFCCFSFHLLCSNLKVAASFHCTLYGYSCADWDDFLEHLRDVSWEDILSNCLPIECFLLTYDLKSCKSRVNRHLLSLDYFKQLFAFRSSFSAFHVVNLNKKLLFQFYFPLDIEQHIKILSNLWK